MTLVHLIDRGLPLIGLPWRRAFAPAWAILEVACMSLSLQAQDSASAPARNFHGLTAGIAVARTSVGFAGGSATSKGGARLDLGYRFHEICRSLIPLCWQRVSWLKPLRLTGGITLIATDIRGMDPDKDTFAYSNVDFGLRASYAQSRRLRYYGEFRIGKKTAELLAPDRLTMWNYAGTAKTMGAGIELPWFDSGRGFELGVSWTKGRFTTYEYFEEEFAANLSHSARVIHFGWSGPFTGISLPWQ